MCETAPAPSFRTSIRSMIRTTPSRFSRSSSGQISPRNRLPSKPTTSIWIGPKPMAASSVVGTTASSSNSDEMRESCDPDDSPRGPGRRRCPWHAATHISEGSRAARFPSRRSRDRAAREGKASETMRPALRAPARLDLPSRRCHDAHVSIRMPRAALLTDADSLKELRRIAPDISPSVARLPMPAYILDRDGVVRWLNVAAVRHFGDIRGKRIAQIVEPEYATLARQEFAAKLLGTQQATEETVAVRTAEGRRVSSTSARRSSSSRARSSACSGSLIRPTSRRVRNELGGADAAATRRPPLRRRRLTRPSTSRRRWASRPRRCGTTSAG